MKETGWKKNRKSFGMKSIRITLLALTILLVAGAWSTAGTRAVTPSVTAATTLVMDDCSVYQDQGSMPPYGCDGSITNATSGSGESGAGYPWPQNLSGWACVNSHCGWWGASEVGGNGTYHGSFWGSGGCFMEFYVTLSYYDAYRIYFGWPRTLYVTPVQMNSCG